MLTPYFKNFLLFIPALLVLGALFFVNLVLAKDHCATSQQFQCYPPGVTQDSTYSFSCVSEATHCTDLLQGEVVDQSGKKCPLITGKNICCKIPMCLESDDEEGNATNTSDVGGSAPKAPSSYKLSNPLGTTNLTQIARNVINTFLGIVGALALIVFIYGGVSYIIAGGNESRVTKAKDTLKYGIIGVFFIMFSFVLTDSFIKLWTVDLGKPTLPGPGEFLEQETEAEQELTSLKEQQDAAKQAEKDAIAEAKKSKTDVCGQTPATQGYSCMTLTSQEQADYDCLSSYCQSKQSASYLCCKEKE